VPVDAFWSVIVYDATGHLKKNDLNAYSLNSVTAQKAADGSVALQFGGCDGKIPNCLPIMQGWNYMVRLYRPRAEILSGKWKFPEAQPVEVDLEMGTGVGLKTTQALGGTSWQLVKFRGGDGATLIADDKAKYTVAFEEDGRVAVRLDCNRGSGTWKSAQPNQLQFGPLALTRAMCLNMTLHDRIANDWTAVRSYVLKNGHLFLSLAADAGTYEFEPSSGDAADAR
jgi:heat shock protein HslJ